MSDRRAPRITAAIGVIVKAGSQPTACMTRTVSITGLFLLTKERWEPGTILDIELIKEEQRFRVQARVAFASDEGVAVAFHEPSPEFTNRFQLFLDDLVARKPEDLSLAQSLDNVLTWKPLNGVTGIKQLFAKNTKRSLLTSLSHDGAAVDASKPPAVGDELVVILNALPSAAVEGGESGAVECRAEVVRHTQTGFAMRFVDPSRQFRAAISQLRRAHRH